MPPPMKNVITSEHEEVLWNSRHLSTDTSIGLIQAVIFYLIKCFGLWQGKDLKLLKTEHVTFGEDEMGKFVAVDVKKAVGSGKVIKRYDDPGNPRSVYKILKTYKGYLANEGPFLVRPISSIKDYICYSPWPLGLNIIEQTVVNLMQECGIGSGFGNVSVCLMAIDILKSFGAGSHCISTWMLRLYPRYKKAFWAETFKECSAINCEDKSEEACLVISHLLDPPYPATTMLVEMRKKQELMKNKTEAMDARRSSVFNSWLSNINSNTDSKEDSDFENKKQKSLDIKAQNKTKVTPKTGSTKEKVQCKTEKVRKNQIKNSSEHKKCTDSPPSSLSTTSLPAPSNITVKAEIMTDIDSTESNSTNSDVKIMTVLSIPESAFSAQVDEAECTANDNVINDATSTCYASEKTVSVASSTSSQNTNTSGLKRKFKCSKNSDIGSSPSAKLSKIYKENGEVNESMPAGRNGSSVDIRLEMEGRVNAVSFCADVKCEPDDECENSSKTAYDDAVMNTEDSDNKDKKERDCSDKDKKEVNDNDSSNNGQELSQGASLENEAQNRNPPTEFIKICEKGSNVQPSPSDKVKHGQCKNKSVAIKLNPEESSTQPEESQFAHILKAEKMTELPPSSLSRSSYTTSVSLNTSTKKFPDKAKDSIEILRNLLQKGDKSAKTGDLGNDSRTLCTEVGLNSLSHTTSGQKTDTEKSLSPNKAGIQNKSQKGSSNVGGKIQAESININHCTNQNSSAASSVLKHIISGKELVNVVAGRSSEKCSTDSLPATDIVTFLNAANVQLQNILQLSTLDSVVDCEIAQSTSRSVNSKQNHAIKDNSSDVTFQPPRLSRKNLELQECPSKLESCVSTDLMSQKTSSSSCHSSRSSSVPSLSEKPKPPSPCVANKDVFCPLLRSVLEEPRSPPAGEISQPSTPKAALSCSSFKTRSAGMRKRFIPVRLKASRLRHLKLKKEEKGFYSRFSNKHKPHLEQKPSLAYKLGTLRYAKNCQSSTRSCLSHCSLNPSSSSLLQQESVSPCRNSGIYSYRSDHQDNAAYQTLQIARENQRTQVFTISDLPLDVSGSKSHKDYLGCPTSEICLGDYFPEGTVLPMKDLKLLTRQSSNGLEVVLKFEYKLHENARQTINQDSQDHKMEVPDGQKEDSTKSDMDSVDS